jgi:hypothetical protein
MENILVLNESMMYESCQNDDINPPVMADLINNRSDDLNPLHRTDVVQQEDEESVYEDYNETTNGMNTFLTSHGSNSNNVSKLDRISWITDNCLAASYDCNNGSVIDEVVASVEDDRDVIDSEEYLDYNELDDIMIEDGSEVGDFDPVTSIVSNCGVEEFEGFEVVNESNEIDSVRIPFEEPSSPNHTNDCVESTRALVFDGAMNTPSTGIINGVDTAPVNLSHTNGSAESNLTAERQSSGALLGAQSAVNENTMACRLGQRLKDMPQFTSDRYDSYVLSRRGTQHTNVRDRDEIYAMQAKIIRDRSSKPSDMKTKTKRIKKLSRGNEVSQPSVATKAAPIDQLRLVDKSMSPRLDPAVKSQIVTVAKLFTRRNSNKAVVQPTEEIPLTSHPGKHDSFPDHSLGSSIPSNEPLEQDSSPHTDAEPIREAVDEPVPVSKAYPSVAAFNRDSLLRLETKSQKIVAGQLLLPLIEYYYPDNHEITRKILLMIVEMDILDILALLESPETLAMIITEAHDVLVDEQPALKSHMTSNDKTKKCIIM